MSRPLDRFGAILIVCLCVVWGFNQVFAKLALADIGPVAQTGVRSAIGVLCLVAYAIVARRRVFVVDGTGGGRRSRRRAVHRRVHRAL